MLVQWSKDGNKCFCIEFDKFNLSNLWKFKKNGSRKGIDSFVEKDFWLFGFKFSFTDVNYDNIVFIKLTPENNYTKSKDSKNINSLKATLNTWIKDKTYPQQHPAFNWNFHIREDGGIVYFITGEKQWFENNGLSSLITPLREITFSTNENYFPKYNPKVTNIVKYIETIK